MDSLALKFQEIGSNYSPKLAPFMQLVSPEEIKEIKEYLLSEGIELNNNKSILVYALSLDEIKSRVNSMKIIDELDAYKEKAERILCKSAAKMISYAKSKDVSYKEDGKYSDELFAKNLFYKKYGKVDINSVDLVVTVNKIEDNQDLEDYKAMIENKVYQKDVPERSLRGQEVIDYEKCADEALRVLRKFDFETRMLPSNIVNRIMVLIENKESENQLSDLEIDNIVIESIVSCKNIIKENVVKALKEVKDESLINNNQDEGITIFDIGGR